MASLRSPSTEPRTSASGQSQEITAYGFAQGQQQYAPQLQDTSLQYQPEFPLDTQRTQQYAQYPAQMMYDMPQQAPQQSPYDPVQQFQHRQPAAVEVLPIQFGVGQYYPAVDPPSTPAVNPCQPPYMSLSSNILAMTTVQHFSLLDIKGFHQTFPQP
jgi:hypothetical protein